MLLMSEIQLDLVKEVIRLTKENLKLREAQVQLVAELGASGEITMVDKKWPSLSAQERLTK